MVLQENVMDIWVKMFEGIEHQWGPNLLPTYPKVFHLNREIDEVDNKPVSTFVKQYIEGHDLTHLYALNAACMEVIEESVRLIEYTDQDKTSELDDTVTLNLEPFPEIQTIIDDNTLIQELHEVTQGKHSSDEGLKTPPNMRALGHLSYVIQKTIEDGLWAMDEKAHAYMCSLTIGNYRNFDYESFIYQLSRGIDCEENLDNFIPYLQEDAKDRTSLYKVLYFYEAEVLRLVQWAKIGNINEQIKEFCKNITLKFPMKFNLGNPDDKYNYDLFVSYIVQPFALLRSDLAIDYLNEILTKYIYACQDILCDNFGLPVNLDADEMYQYAKIKTATCYVFGAYRLGIDKFDNHIIRESTNYIQAQQLPDASFLPPGSFSLK